MQTYIAFTMYMINILGNIETESEQLVKNTQDSINGLERNGMIGTNMAFGSTENINVYSNTVKAKIPGILMQPTVFGAQVYLAISSVSGPANRMLSKEIEIPLLVDIKMLPEMYFQMPYE